MFQRTKLHNGLMADCAVCTPERKKKRRDREGKPKRERATNLEGYLRRQMAEETGEDELSKDERFQLMQKYGTIAPRIDRRITKPNWMEESRWRILKQEFHSLTKGLVPSQQFKPTRPSVGPSRPRSSQVRPSNKRPTGNQTRSLTPVPPLTPRQP